MKGKVNCTCGWSWNKSDSSKKDMYICHECGRDNSNNMKNGGWLDQYADGGTMQEHQENYNNSQASAPEGMVGDGFSNVGRNYSPAWGGQFQEGGEIPNAQKGKKVKPIYVESKNDPRYKAYKDSLNLHTRGEEWFSNKHRGKNTDPDIKKKFGEFPLLPQEMIDNALKNKPTGKKKIITGDGFITERVKDSYINGKLVNSTIVDRKVKPGTTYYKNTYDKPQQQVIVKKQEERKPIQTIENNLQPIGIQNDFNIEADIPQIRQQVRQPKYYDIQENINQPFGGSQTNYRTSDLNSITSPDDLGPGNTRKIIPHYQEGGKLTFLQPTSDKLPEGYRIPYDTPSTERAGSIGGENGEPAYLVPTFKYGKPIYNAIEEFKRTGEHLGGPFKTWQEAEEWENTVRHPAVENRETIMFPQEKFAMGGSVYPVNYVPQAQNGTGNISAYKEQDYLDRGWDILSNPLTSFGYVARNEEIPDYLDRGLESGQIKRNALENTLDLVNPIYYLNSAGRGAKDLITGDAKGFIGEAFNFIPALKTTQKVGKIAKNSNKLKTFINTIGDVDAFLHATTGKDLISEGKEAQKKELEKIKKKQMGGSLPGATGHMYSRTKGIPSEGPYAKKTMPSAQNGGWLDGYKEGGSIKDDRGQWDHPGEITEIGSNQITMEGVPYDVLGVSDTGDTKLMKPGKNYKFKGKKVTEFPIAKNGLRQEQKGLQNLDNLTNFTNYNKPQPGSWLEKYN